jgi:hypothetical protein
MQSHLYELEWGPDTRLPSIFGLIALARTFGLRLMSLSVGSILTTNFSAITTEAFVAVQANSAIVSPLV